MSYAKITTPGPIPSWAATALTESGGGAVLINGYPLRDTGIHNYRTDPSYIYLVRVPRGVTSYAIWVYNTTNQTINVQAIGNVTNDQTYPDYTIGSTYSDSTGTSDMYVLSAESALTPFASVQINAATAPTSGVIYALAIVE
jgi:hypothetical protein